MMNYKGYEAVIGIEVHVQLSTKNKIFCFCLNQPDVNPNTNICPTCCGYPGTLPLLNKNVVDSAIKAGLALQCKINEHNEFARKHYFYADLPKGYQITQSDFPICTEGHVEIIKASGEMKKIRIQRIHMEEDAGKNIHTEHYGSLVDYNRAGTPLLEIVSYPDISDAEEAYLYLKQLHSIVCSQNITSGNMEDGAFRADTNISVRPIGQKEFGTKCELKNINSFKFIKDATEYEIKRQVDMVINGDPIIQQTRLWDTKIKQTYAMRNKESAADYRYFKDPDLMSLHVDEAWINAVKSTMNELPKDKKNRFIKDYDITDYEAQIIIDEPLLSDFFQKCYSAFPSKSIIGWVLREIASILKDKNDISHISPLFLASLIKMIEKNEVTIKVAQDIFKYGILEGIEPVIYAQNNGLLGKVLNEHQIEEIVLAVLSDYPNSKEEFRSGKTRIKGFLIGKIMAKTQGNASPDKVSSLLDKLLL